MENKNFALRVPVALYERLKVMAEWEGRSLNSQILIILRGALEKWEEGRKEKELMEFEAVNPNKEKGTGP